MILIDILCVSSCARAALSYGRRKAAYYILKSDGLLDRLAVNILTALGWRFIPLEYELKPGDSGNPFLNIHRDLKDMTEKHLRPVIENEIYGCKCFSAYEKKRISVYIEHLERKYLCRSIEILHILELIKDRIGRPEVILMRR
ncbi:hypothetical protein ACFL42_04930, partial [Candidatus Omnitrophota bacterium]